MLSFGFPPVSSPSSRVLILESLPGRLSLERGEYYANPQNAFWKIVATRVPELPSNYPGRAAVLIEHGVALWDVLAAATLRQSRCRHCRRCDPEQFPRVLSHPFQNPTYRIQWRDGG
jgi:TDG/mug DNA glycosylase family protein